MKGFPPFEAENGTQAPSGKNWLGLLQFALQTPDLGGVQVVRFDGTILEVRTVQAPPAYTCTSASKLHTPSGQETLSGAVVECCKLPHGSRERCATCGNLISYHDFPGRGPRSTILVSEAPARVGDNLKGPIEERDTYLLLHIPRALADAFDEQATRRIVLPGEVPGNEEPLR